MPVSNYQVTYATPTCRNGVAHVTAEGIYDTLSEATNAIRILTGYDKDMITLEAVIDEDGKTLWQPENLL